LTITLASCEIEPEFIDSNLVKFESIQFDMKNLVLLEYENDYMVKSLEFKKDTIEWRGIDSYTCISRDSTLEIDFSYGIMSNGQGLNLMVKNDSVFAKLYNWSDGAKGESFNYNISELELTLSNENYLNSDTITGNISIVGEENIADTKEDHILLRKLNDWEAFEKSYFKTKVSLKGEFKLLKVKYASDGGLQELNRTKLYHIRRFDDHIDIVESNNLDSLNAERMKWKEIPKKVLEQTQVKTLNLQGNKLFEVDFICLSSMEHLTKLDLRWNQFRDFPQNVLENKNLEHLNLFGNPIEDLPISELLKSNITYINMKGSKIDTSNLYQLRDKMIVEI